MHDEHDEDSEVTAADFENTSVVVWVEERDTDHENQLCLARRIDTS